MAEKVIEHIGDGVYASFNKDYVGQIYLTANHHSPHAATDIIHLDEDVLRSLVRVAKRAGVTV